jgi:hypothetical protein
MYFFGCVVRMMEISCGDGGGCPVVVRKIVLNLQQKLQHSAKLFVRAANCESN